MKKFRFPVFADTLFVFVCLWFMFVCIFRYARLSAAASVITAALVSLACSLAFFFLLSRSREKKFLNKREEEEKARLMLHLALSDEAAVGELFSALLGEKYRKSGACLLCGNERAVPLFFMQPLSADAVAGLVKKYPKSKLVLYVNDLSPEAKALCARLHVSYKGAADVYLALKEKGLLPETYICEENAKKTLADRLSLFFQKRNAKSFFFCGVGLLFFSLFALFPLYYVLSGSLLLLLSLAVRFFPRKA